MFSRERQPEPKRGYEDRGPYDPRYDGRYPQERFPLLQEIGRALSSFSRGSARIDLIRPSRANAVPLQQGAGILGLPALHPSSLFEPDPQQGRGDPDYEAFGEPRVPANRRAGLLGTRSGARVKVMRHIDFGYHNRAHAPSFDNYDQELRYREQTGQPEQPDISSALSEISHTMTHNLLGGSKPWFDLGFGLNFELDSAALDIKARLKVKDFFSIKLLPRPTFRLQKRVFLPGSAAAVRVNYEVPLIQALDRDRTKPVPARLWLRMENAVGFGTHLTPSGLDFDEHSWYLGAGTSLRTGASLGFPRQIPIPPGESVLNWRVQRMGLKTIW